jgi:hypothetical protein
MATVAVLALLVVRADATTGPGSDALQGMEMAGVILAQADSIDGQVGGVAKSVIRELRRSWNTVRWMFGRAANWWGGWIKLAAFSIGVAIVASLADAGLMNAFRMGGVRALVSYVPLMLFVYLRLLLSSGVSLAPKVLLLGTLVYGAIRRDLLPDRSLIPGRLEDILLIVIATRAFIYACPEALVSQYAERAVSWRRRVAGLQQRNG